MSPTTTGSTHDLFEQLKASLAGAGLRVASLGIEQQQLRIGHIDGFDAALSVWAAAAGSGRAFATVGPLGWSYRAPSQDAHRTAAELCKRVIAALVVHAPQIAEALSRSKGEPAPTGQKGRVDFLPAYRSDTEALRTGPWVDYPTCVNIETIVACPAKCTFCTYPTLARLGQRMSDELLDKVMSDLEAIPITQPFVLYPFLINEPLAEKRLDAILERTERRLPQAGVDLISTATLLDEARTERLAARKNIRELTISLNFDNAPEYEAEMKLPWARTWTNVLALHEAALGGRLPFRVVISRVGSGDARDARFSAFIAEHLPAFELRLLTRHGWLGHLAAPRRSLDELPCTQWFELKVTVSGKVALCCQDSHVEHPVGDVNSMSLLEIYNLPEARARRVNLPARRHLEACRGCSFNRY